MLTVNVSKTKKSVLAKATFILDVFSERIFLRSKNNVNFTKICFLKPDCISMRR